MNVEVWRRLELETALRHAVKNEEFSCTTSPRWSSKVPCRGCGGLAALDRPGLGLVQPSEFIYALEDSGLIR